MAETEAFLYQLCAQDVRQRSAEVVIVLAMALMAAFLAAKRLFHQQEQQTEKEEAEQSQTQPEPRPEPEPEPEPDGQQEQHVLQRPLLWVVVLVAGFVISIFAVPAPSFAPLMIISIIYAIWLWIAHLSVPFNLKRHGSCCKWLNEVLDWQWGVHFATIRTILALWICLFFARAVMSSALCYLSQHMFLGANSRVESSAQRVELMAASVSMNDNNQTNSSANAAIHLSRCEAECDSDGVKCTVMILLFGWVLVGMPLAAQIERVRIETKLDKTSNPRSKDERTNLQLWNFLHACLQCDPSIRPTPKTVQEAQSVDWRSRLSENHRDYWCGILSTGLNSQEKDIDKYSFPVVDEKKPVRLRHCWQQFDQRATCPTNEQPSAEYRTGVEAQLVLTPHKLLPFETFRSFRASLTSNRHHSPDLEVILDGRKYRVFVAAVEENYDEEFDKSRAKLSEQVKWAYRTEDKSIIEELAPADDVRTIVSRNLTQLEGQSNALGNVIKRKEAELLRMPTARAPYRRAQTLPSEVGDLKPEVPTSTSTDVMEDVEEGGKGGDLNPLGPGDVESPGVRSDVTPCEDGQDVRRPSGLAGPVEDDDDSHHLVQAAGLMHEAAAWSHSSELSDRESAETIQNPIANRQGPERLAGLGMGFVEDDGDDDVPSSAESGHLPSTRRCQVCSVELTGTTGGGEYCADCEIPADDL